MVTIASIPTVNPDRYHWQMSVYSMKCVHIFLLVKVRPCCAIECSHSHAFIVGESPRLCCDRKQLAEMQKFKYIVDNLIGRCPSCYYNFLRIFCEMTCSPDQDQFLWPLSLTHIVPPSSDVQTTDEDQEDGVREDWALPDYVDPEDEADETVKSRITLKPVATVEVVTKVRYFVSEAQANDFMASCW